MKNPRQTVRKLHLFKKMIDVSGDGWNVITTLKPLRKTSEIHTYLASTCTEYSCRKEVSASKTAFGLNLLRCWFNWRVSPACHRRSSRGLHGAGRYSQWAYQCRPTRVWRCPSTATPWCSLRPTRGLCRMQTKDTQTASSTKMDNYGESSEKDALCFTLWHVKLNNTHWLHYRKLVMYTVFFLSHTAGQESYCMFL